MAMILLLPAVAFGFLERVGADDAVINAMDAVLELKAMSADVRSLAIQTVGRMRSEAELGDFCKRFCDRMAMGRFIGMLSKWPCGTICGRS